MPHPLDPLAALAHADGGWGYVAGQPAHLEPTCLALLALKPEADRFAAAVAGGRCFLRACRRPDGSYRLARGRDAAVWGTALALFTEAAYRDGETPSGDETATAAVLLGVKGHVVQADPEVADMCDIDVSLAGWPWGEGTFSWVEPTSWACLALHRLRLGDHPRVREGERLLLDRAFEQGGANYGNRMILGRMTEPIPGPTALLLLALQGHRGEPRVQAAVRYLREQLAASHDLEHLGWGRLALDLYRDEPGVAEFLPRLDDRIRTGYAERQAVPWLKPSPPREALTALALNCDRWQPFRHPVAPAGDPLRGCPAVEPREPKPAGKPLGERMRSMLKGVVVRGLDRMRQPPAQSRVHIAKASDYSADLAAVVRRQYEHFRAEVPLAGKRVVLKPNLVEYHRDKVINTDPRVVAAVIELCQSEGAAEVIVAEGPGHWRNLEYLAAESGLGDVLKRYNVPLVDLNHDEPIKTLNLGRLTGLEYLYLTRTVASADVFVSLAKLKTHHWAGATLSLKNLFGTLPGICYGWPKNELHFRGIPNSIIDIALTQTPHLAIVDGIVGMEGDGPLNGTARHVGALVMGTDLVAVDATCCRLMGLPAERIVHLALGAHKKLGRLEVDKIEQLGEPIAALAQAFAPPPRFDKLLLPQEKSA
ncbi:MAG TPA: DUF362 domain-containing protein [Gemmataceae bacterium]|jgi:uncharacterized protein (DUF362 family)